MPFVYYGGKKGLARYYPPPAFGTIIEPFAGSAGYALHWATPKHRVILVERDPAVAALWRRLQAPDARDDLMAIDCPPAGERAVEPLIELACGRPLDSGRTPGENDPIPARAAGPARTSDALLLTMQGGLGSLKALKHPESSFVVTSRMARDWKRTRATLIRALPTIRPWTIIEGDYTAAPNRTATWFIDPPYQVPAAQKGTRGDGYRYGADLLDFDQLAGWCRARRGQVIVCEQAGATWLPFRPLRNWSTAAGDGGRRLEVVWTRTPAQVVAGDRRRQLTDEAKARRSARRSGRH